MKKPLLMLICLFVSFGVNSSDKKSITKLTDYEKCMKELEDDDTKIFNSTINRKSGELHLYFHNDEKKYRLDLTGNEGTCLVYKKIKKLQLILICLFVSYEVRSSDDLDNSY